MILRLFFLSIQVVIYCCIYKNVTTAVRLLLAVWLDWNRDFRIVRYEDIYIGHIHIPNCDVWYKKPDIFIFIQKLTKSCLYFTYYRVYNSPRCIPKLGADTNIMYYVTYYSSNERSVGLEIISSVANTNNQERFHKTVGRIMKHLKIWTAHHQARTWGNRLLVPDSCNCTPQFVCT